MQPSGTNAAASRAGFSSSTPSKHPVPGKRVTRWGKDEVDLLSQHDLFAGIARLLAHTTERAMGHGVQHGYVERRGRTDPLMDP
jgi:hypothetical protein